MNIVAGMLLVMLGGAVGALSRFGCQKAAERWTRLPGWMAIFFVNILGSFLIGLSFGWLTGLEYIDKHTKSLSALDHFKDTQDLGMAIEIYSEIKGAEATLNFLQDAKILLM